MRTAALFARKQQEGNRFNQDKERHPSAARDEIVSAKSSAANDDKSMHSMEIIETLSDLFDVYERSATLDGSLPLRAVQGCKPVLDGNSAGLHIRLAIPAVLDPAQPPRVRVGRYRMGDIDEMHANALKRILDQGLLVENGYWHRQLRKGVFWAAPDGCLCIWTGLLARAAPNACILIGPAYNRRCNVLVQESVIADDTGFTPVILKLDPSAITSNTLLYRAELACLIPLDPQTEFTHESIEDNSDLVHHFDKFYEEKQQNTKRAGQYRSLVRGDSDEIYLNAPNKIVDLGGPDCYEICQFDEVVTADGPTKEHPYSASLRYVKVLSVARVSGRCDGSTIIGPTIHNNRIARQLTSVWHRLGGREDSAIVKLLTKYVVGIGANLQEPRFTAVPAIFLQSPTGWSTIVDAYDAGIAEGWRGVIATDIFPILSPVWQVTSRGNFAFKKGAPLVRAIPVPRKLLRAPVKRTSLTT
ncbi:hypothetical protein [Streptomyces sp. NPDC001139]